MENKKLKTILIVIVISILLIIGISIYFIIDESQKTATIDLMVAPLSADISLNGKKYENTKEHRVKPGEYEVKIEKNGYFEPYSETFSIGNGETKKIYVILSPLGGTNWYESHPDDAFPMDAIIGSELKEQSNRLMEEYPLLTSLPLTVEYYENGTTYVYYIISYDLTSEDNIPVILIKDYTGGNYENAIERINNLGFNPSDYTIEYQDKTSDLTTSRAPSD